MYQAQEILIPIAAMAMVFGIVYLGVTAHNRKTLAMIEAGMNPNKKEESQHSKIRTALLFTFVPLGIFLGNILSDYTILRNKELGLLFGFLFGGLALVISYFIDKKKEENETNLLD